MQGEYRFHIADSFTPETLPMFRLAEYVAPLARLLGEPNDVHFVGVEPGSAVLKARVGIPAQPKVRTRLTAVRNGVGPVDAQRAVQELDDLLRKDNGSGTLCDETGGVVIAFPGRGRPEPLVYGPFRQDGTLEGQLFRIGGKDATVPVHLRDGELTRTGLYCTPELARRMCVHLYGPTLRVRGTGRWFRDGHGDWLLQEFKIVDFEVLDDASLTSVVSDLRALPGSKWSDLADPVRVLLEERGGGRGEH
jgi:hypothetical protein